MCYFKTTGPLYCLEMDMIKFLINNNLVKSNASQCTVRFPLPSLLHAHVTQSLQLPGQVGGLDLVVEIRVETVNRDKGMSSQVAWGVSDRFGRAAETRSHLVSQCYQIVLCSETAVSGAVPSFESLQCLAPG